MLSQAYMRESERTGENRRGDWQWPRLSLFLVISLVPILSGRADGQIIGLSLTSEYQLSNDVRVNEADGAVRTRLREIEEAMAGQHWDEVVPAIREIVTRAGDRLINVTAKMKGVPPRYISMREYCQLLLTRLPEDGLIRYRQLSDPNCQLWLEQGLEREEETFLRRISDGELASSYADQALWFLGEWALQSGAPDRARFFWRQLLPLGDRREAFPTWRAVATCRYSPAAIRARLILATILEGDLSEARRALAEFTTVHGSDRGRLGGREQDLTSALVALLNEAEHWPPRSQQEGWRTFGGTFRRSSQIATPFEITGVAWRLKLPQLPRALVTQWSEVPSARLLAEDYRPFAFFPVVNNRSVFVATFDKIYGVNLLNGNPLWGTEETEIFSLTSQDREQLIPVNSIGARRITATIENGELYVRLGSPVTISPALMPTASPQRSALVALDLNQEGKLLWMKEPPESGWSFEGAPAISDDGVYIVMRKTDVPPHIYLTCLHRETGEIKWQQFICAADTPGRSMLCEMTHLLPTLAEEMVYVLTNAGAIAAIDRESGAIRWLTCYPRIARGDLATWEPFRFREPNPAVYRNGELYVAPTDSRSVLGVDAFTGTLLWDTGPEGERIEHLLGVVDGCLIGTGDRVYWVALRGPRAGRIVARWPLGSEYLGYGRGIIAGNLIYWPVRNAIYILDGATAQPRRVIDLSPWNVSGGNLIYSDGYLVVTSSEEIVAFSTVPVKSLSSDHYIQK